MSFRKLLGLGLFALCACREDVLSDPSFDRWCGDQLCQWHTDEGVIARTASWHEEDHAVELVGAPVQLSQHTDASSSCLVVRMISDVDPATKTVLQVDFNDDGHVDYERALPRARWQLAQFSITAPSRYLGARVILRKQKPGRAVVAQLRVESSSGCTEPAVQLRNAQAGALCSLDAECAAGRCADGRCWECSLSAPCADGQLCVEHTCSACADDGDCTDGERCVWLGASIADGRGCVGVDEPLEKDLLAPCDHDDECASGSCAAGSGAARLCGQPCSTFLPLPPAVASCDDGEVCRSLIAPGITSASVCAPAAELGTRCDAAEECASHACCEHRCVPSEDAC